MGGAQTRFNLLAIGAGMNSATHGSVVGGSPSNPALVDWVFGVHYSTNFRHIYRELTCGREEESVPLSGQQMVGVQLALAPRVADTTIRVFGSPFPAQPKVDVGLYPIVTFQYSSTTLYQFSYHIQ